MTPTARTDTARRRRLWMGAAAAVFVAAAGVISLVGGGAAMADEQFEQDFRTATESSGAPYGRARDAVLTRGTESLSALKPLQTSPDWNTALVADIIVGWITERDRFEQCTRYVRGELTGRLPITGSFTPNQRIAAIEILGRGVVPRLLEMLLKTREFRDGGELGAIFGSLTRFGDRRAVPPFIELLTDPDPLIGELAASSLGELGDPRAVAPLLSVLRDRSQPPSVRDAAAMSLGTLRVRDAVPDLEQIVRDEKLDVSPRMVAARALGEIGDPRASATLSQALGRTEDLGLLVTLIEALGETGDASSVAALRAVQQKHSDLEIQQAATEAIDKIGERRPR